MKPDILTKLASELQMPITSERQVVYILVELRKLMELNGDGTQYKALKFQCDWIVHSLLRGQQAQEIVRLIDRYQELEGNTTAKQGHPDTSFMGQLGPTPSQ